MTGCEVDSEQTTSSKFQESAALASAQDYPIGSGKVAGWQVGAMKMSRPFRQAADTHTPTCLQSTDKPTFTQHSGNEAMHTAWALPSSTDHALPSSKKPRKRKIAPVASEELTAAQQVASKTANNLRANVAEPPPGLRSAFKRQDPRDEGRIFKQDLVDVIAALGPDMELDDISSMVDAVGHGSQEVDYEELFDFLYADDSG